MEMLPVFGEKANSQQRNQNSEPQNTIIKEISSRGIWKSGYNHVDDKS